MRSLPTITVLLATALVAVACNPIERAGRRPRSGNNTERIDGQNTVATIHRGTVGAECAIVGWDDQSSPSYRPTVVRGYGLVVNLDSTGSGDIPPDVRAHMLQVMARHGVGKESVGFGHLDSESMLDSQDTAVVIVEAIVPQGATGRRRTPPVSGREAEVLPGTTFDVMVTADPRTSTTSLEGGRLYTTDLRPGPLMAGSRQAFALAEASGPLFINPFVGDTSTGTTDITLRTARVLNGGQVTKDMPMKLMLINPSHTRVRLIQNAINRRFPFEPGQGQDTAHGENDSSIELTVPPSMRDETNRFVNMVMRTTLAQSRAELVANSTRRQLLADPSIAQDAYWRWIALGPRALPFIRELYDHAEETPRLVALRAGAYLQDSTVGDPLRSMGLDGSLAARLEAADLMRRLPPDPRIDLALFEMLEDEDLEVRLRSYEALRDRRSQLLRTMPIEAKFGLDVVPSTFSTIYITQSGTPRIAALGGDLPIKTPLTIEALGGRLLVRDDPSSDGLALRYQTDDMPQGVILRCDARVSDLVRALAYKPRRITDPDGLNLSYGEAVSTLHELWKAGHLEGDFKAEQDRVLAELRRWGTLTDYQQRPDFGTAEDTQPPTSLQPAAG